MRRVVSFGCALLVLTAMAGCSKKPKEGVPGVSKDLSAVSPANAFMVARIDMAAMRASKLGKELTKLAQENAPLDEKGELAKRMSENAQSALVFVSAPASKTDKPIVVASVEFSSGKIRDELFAFIEKESPNHATEKIAGRDVHIGSSDHGPTVYFFPQGDAAAVFLISENADPKAELTGVLENKTSPALLSKVSSKGQFALTLDTASVKDQLASAAQAGPQGQMAAQLNTADVILDLEGANLLTATTVFADPAIAEAAKGQVEQGKMMGAMFVGMMGANPKATEDQKKLGKLASDLLSGITVAAEEGTLSITVPKPEGLDELPMLLESLKDMMPSGMSEPGPGAFGDPGPGAFGDPGPDAFDPPSTAPQSKLELDLGSDSSIPEGLTPPK